MEPRRPHPASSLRTLSLCPKKFSRVYEGSPCFPSRILLSRLFSLLPLICNSLTLCLRPTDKWVSPLLQKRKICSTCFCLELRATIPSSPSLTTNFLTRTGGNTLLPEQHWTSPQCLPCFPAPGWHLPTNTSIQPRRRQGESHYTFRLTPLCSILEPSL